MHLINQQDMDTLPENGEVFIRYDFSDGVFKSHEVTVLSVRDIRNKMEKLPKNYKFYSWSYEASTRPINQQQFTGE